jgi:hypothetical protein
MKMIKTRVGLTTLQNNYYCGFDVSKDLVGVYDTLDLITLSAINRKLRAEEKKTIYALGTSQCVADPHAWPLKITRRGARNVSFFHGMASALSYFEKAKIGPHQTKISAELLLEWTKTSQKEELVTRYDGQPVLPGFGVFGRPKDERVIAFKQWLSDTNFETGIHFSAYEALILALPERNENNTLITAAILLDMGFSLHDMESLAFFLLLPPVFSNALEAAKDQNLEMQTIPGPIEYKGPASRTSPRQNEAKS